jgi:hypothetical protein
MPLIAIGIAVLVWIVNPRSLMFAAPFLIVWASARLLTHWLNRPPHGAEPVLTPAAVLYLRRVALLTWRYFAEFSTSEEHWLIPDNVEEKGMHVAARVSPTNLGLLVNARQVAQRLGYLTVPQFVELTGKTLLSLEQMEKFRGHLFNWYDTRTLQPLPPRVVSSVDNGNLLASLLTLSQGCSSLLDAPLLSRPLLQGLLDLDREATAGEGVRKDSLPTPRPNAAIANDWAGSLLALTNQPSSEAGNWFSQAITAQKAAISFVFQSYFPWLLPEFRVLVRSIQPRPIDLERLTPALLPSYVDDLDAKLQQSWNSHQQNDPQLLQIEPLRLRLAAARENAARLTASLNGLANRAHALADAMDFSILLHPTRRLLSIAYNVEQERIEEACYDLLASEARTAVFLAIAKGDIAQEAWFQLGRSHQFDHDQPLLVSWTGTMFEYLMPNLWMRSSRGSMLDRTQNAAVRAHRLYGKNRKTPWGISEAGYATLGADGHYQYHAFGVPSLAVSPNALDGGPVIAPYATCLALPVDPANALKNLHAMTALGWMAGRGFYEAADYSRAAENGGQPVLVRSWMAHHQGMTLLALLNVLDGERVKEWFHADKRVQATQLLLHERPMKASALATLRNTAGAPRPERSAPAA